MAASARAGRGFEAGSGKREPDENTWQVGKSVIRKTHAFG